MKWLYLVSVLSIFGRKNSIDVSPVSSSLLLKGNQSYEKRTRQNANRAGFRIVVFIS